MSCPMRTLQQGLIIFQVKQLLKLIHLNIFDVLMAASCQLPLIGWQIIPQFLKKPRFLYCVLRVSIITGLVFSQFPISRGVTLQPFHHCQALWDPNNTSLLINFVMYYTLDWVSITSNSVLVLVSIVFLSLWYSTCEFIEWLCVFEMDFIISPRLAWYLTHSLAGPKLSTLSLMCMYPFSRWIDSLLLLILSSR